MKNMKTTMSFTFYYIRKICDLPLNGEERWRKKKRIHLLIPIYALFWKLQNFDITMKILSFFFPLRRFSLKISPIFENFYRYIGFAALFVDWNDIQA